MPRIVHLIDYFHPNAGYQSNILSKYLQKKGYINIIITPILSASKDDNYYSYLTAFLGEENINELDNKFTFETGVQILRVNIYSYFSSRAIYKNSLFQSIDCLKPDILFVYDIDSYSGIRYIFRAKKLDYPVIFNSTMLEMASKNKFAKIFRLFYRNLITPIIVKRNLRIIKTQDDDYIHRVFKIPERLATYVSFGSDTSLFFPDNSYKHKFRERYQLRDNEILFIYAGKLDRDKGLDLLAKAFKEKIISESGFEAVLVLVGNFNNDDHQIKRAFSSIATKTIEFNTVPYIELDKFYKSCDYSIFPKQVSLSFFDVQASGLPVILENNEINNQRTSFNNGYVYDKENFLDLRKTILNILEEHPYYYNEVSKNCVETINMFFSWDLITDKYIEIFNNTIMDFKRGFIND